MYGKRYQYSICNSIVCILNPATVLAVAPIQHHQNLESRGVDEEVYRAAVNLPRVHNVRRWTYALNPNIVSGLTIYLDKALVRDGVPGTSHHRCEQEVRQHEPGGSNWRLWSSS